MEGIVLLETKNEYTDHFVELLAPQIYSCLEGYYNEAVICAAKANRANDVLNIFQEYLGSIKTWNTNIIRENTSRFKNNSNSAEYFDDMILAIIRLNLNMLTYSNQISNVISKKFYEGFTSEMLVHQCCIDCSKYAYNNPYMFYRDSKTGTDFYRNRSIIQDNIRTIIRSSIRKCLPLGLVLKEFLANTINMIEPDIELISASSSSCNRRNKKSANSPKSLENKINNIFHQETSSTTKDKLMNLITISELIDNVTAEKKSRISDTRDHNRPLIIDIPKFTTSLSNRKTSSKSNRSAIFSAKKPQNDIHTTYPTENIYGDIDALETYGN
jgi:hypothetical protein